MLLNFHPKVESLWAEGVSRRLVHIRISEIDKVENEELEIVVNLGEAS